jgi:hypothetical protein
VANYIINSELRSPTLTFFENIEKLPPATTLIITGKQIRKSCCWMLSLPEEYRYSMGNPRYFHGEAMKDLLPEEVLNRRDKAELSILILQQIEALNRDALWRDPAIVKMGIVDRKIIEYYEAKFQNRKLRGYDLQRYWRIINLEYWYQYSSFLDKPE